METIPEEAVKAAARAKFDHSLLAGHDPSSPGRSWLIEEAAYRDIARAALEAALPHLKGAGA